MYNGATPSLIDLAVKKKEKKKKPRYTQTRWPRCTFNKERFNEIIR